MSTLAAFGPVVYALRMDDGAIKIGFTTNLAERERTVRQQAKSATSDLLAFVQGTWDDEQAIHVSLKPHVAHGREYYHPTPEVLAVVNRMRDQFNLPHIAA